MTACGAQRRGYRRARSQARGTGVSRPDAVHGDPHTGDGALGCAAGRQKADALWRRGSGQL